MQRFTRTISMAAKFASVAIWDMGASRRSGFEILLYFPPGRHWYWHLGMGKGEWDIGREFAR